jgi:hypothetical protein
MLAFLLSDDIDIDDGSGGGEMQMISCEWDGTPYISPVLGSTAPPSHL